MDDIGEEVSSAPAHSLLAPDTMTYVGEVFNANIMHEWCNWTNMQTLFNHFHF